MPKKTLRSNRSASRSKTPHQLELQRLEELTQYEAAALSEGFSHVAGVDEAGRGPLAGPVVAAACVISWGLLFEGINDSKLLSRTRRKSLYQTLVAHPGVRIGVGVIEADEIDRINIYQATIAAMHAALDALGGPLDYLLADAIALDYQNLPCQKLIRGDQRSQSIAAASIVAKEKRDALMERHHETYPHYGFQQHKGYGTAAHLQALATHGPCPLHRLSFTPVRNAQKGVEMRPAIC